MFTYCGMKQISCTLVDDKIAIGDKDYEITCLKNITEEKSKTVIPATMLTIVAVICGGEGAREFLSGDRIGSLFLLVPFVFIVTLVLYLFTMMKSQNKCRSIWRINLFHIVCIEKADDPQIEAVLLSLPLPDETSFAKPTHSFFTKTDIIVTAALAVVFLLGIKGITPAWTLMLLPGYGIYLRAKDALWDYRNQKWQPPTRG